jgi:hypothetical protein
MTSEPQWEQFPDGADRSDPSFPFVLPRTCSRGRRGTLMSRMTSMLPFDYEEGLVGLLLGDAGRALRTAFRLAYSPDEGLWRIRLYEDYRGS